MTPEEKKKHLEEALRKVGKMPAKSGSVTLHVSSNNKVKSIETREIE